MKKFLQKFRKNEDGVVSVEFAMIAPMMIFGTLFAINLGYQVNKHQKLASSLTAGANYLQDYALNEKLQEMRPNWNSDTGVKSDTAPLTTVKNVIQTAYGNDLQLNEIYIDTYCACPNNKVPDADGSGEIPLPGEFEIATENNTTQGEKDFDFADPEQDYYTKTQMSLWKKGTLCDFECPGQNGRARVIMELDVYHSMVDLFGKRIVAHEKLKTRLR